MAPDPKSLIASLSGKLIVSCQDYTEIMIDAAIRGGASGLRINGPRDVRIARNRCYLPIIACNKMHFPGSPIYITPSVRAARMVVQAGADFVALDCTNRPRYRQPMTEIIAAIHDAGALAVADLSCLSEAQPAKNSGADILATTLAPTYDLHFAAGLVRLGLPVLAEGHVDTPERAKALKEVGVWAICVGTAITRPHVLTELFKEAIGA